jgi:hypothetical protein
MHDNGKQREEVKKQMMRPEDREAVYKQMKIERYEWAKQVDPTAVIEYEKNVARQITGATRIASS